MSDGTLGVELVTPEGVVERGQATGVVLRTRDGDLTVLDGHTPLVGELVPSVVRVLRGDADDDAYVVAQGGFIEVATEPGAAVGLLDGATEAERSTRVSVLVATAEAVAELDVARATAARDRATAALSSLSGREDDQAAGERETAERELARAELRLEAAGATAR